MAKQTFTTGQVLTASQLTSLQQTAMMGGAASAKTASYVLTAADAGGAVSMNNASATTITVNTGLFSEGDTVQITNLGAGVCTITAGTATVNTASSLALAQYESGTLDFNSTSNAIFIKGAGASSSGGTWAAWTPTLSNLTIGNGTVTARYAQVGKIVNFYVKITLGSTSSVGTEPRVTWPVTPANTTAAQNALINYVFEDSGLSRYFGASDPITNSTTEFRFVVNNASATYVTSTQITSSIPITWGTSDALYAMGTYEAA
ncbi:MAG: hypothetical protein EBU12_05965 [Microbacteriaceae bacterium]|nr:hypothetical protein [Microbacteriaceae bacterium]